MKRANVIPIMLAALAAVLLAGCHDVVSKQPLPQARLSAEEQAHFAGEWLLKVQDGEVATYVVAFDCKGVAHLASLNWSDNKFTLKQGLLTIAQGANPITESGYLSLPADRTDKRGPYALARYRFVSPRDLVLWLADPAPFDAAIKAGRLKGKSSERATELTSAPQQVLEFLYNPANPPLFGYQNPLLLHKVMDGTRAAPCEK